MQTLIHSKYIWLLILSLLVTGCGKDLDLNGLVKSDTTPDERFVESTKKGWMRSPREITIDTCSYSLIFAADCHIGTTRNFSKLLDLSRLPGVTGLFLAGDMSTGHAEDYDTLKNLLNRTDSVNWYMTVGNHDLFFGGWKLFFSYFGSSAYTVIIKTPQGSDLYICLDTGGGTLGGNQLQWLKDLLSGQRDDFRNCIVVTHNNFFRDHFTESTNPLVEEISTLLDLFAEYRVDMVITGHDHKRYEEEFGPTAYITLDGLEDGLASASYLELTVEKGIPGYQFLTP